MYSIVKDLTIGILVGPFIANDIAGDTNTKLPCLVQPARLLQSKEAGKGYENMK